MDKKKIYLIFECYDSYEDYKEYLLKAFFEKEKAINYKRQKENELEKNKIQYKKYCSKCSGYGIIPNGCNKYETDEEYLEDNCCINQIEWYDIDDLSYTIKEIEVG